MKDNKAKATTAMVKVSTGDAIDSDDDADGGLILVQNKHRLEGGGKASGDVEAGQEAIDGPPQKKKKKERKMRITSDGVAATGVARKKVFDEDGAAVVSFSYFHLLGWWCGLSCRPCGQGNESIQRLC